MKRNLALFISAAMVLSVFASCGGNGGDTNSADAGMVSETTSELETIAELIDFFDEDYDPFSDDYDPYGGGGASAARHSPETDSVPDNSEIAEEITDSSSTETAAPVANNTPQAATAKPKSEGKSSVNTDVPAETTALKKLEEQKSSSDVVLTINSSNSWENGSDKFTQLDVSVKNNSDRAINGWTVTIPVASGAKVDQSWNCELSIKNDTLTATPVDHNSFVDVGSEGTFGMILCNAGSVDSSKAEVRFGTSTVNGTGGNSGQNNNNGGGNIGSVGNNNPKIVQAKDVPAPTTNDWLYTDGSKIVDKDGKEVWLTGVNWFGYNTGTNTFDGLWACDLNTSIAAIADRGFNLLRIPISTELIKNWSNGNYPNANFNQATNSYLVEIGRAHV